MGEWAVGSDYADNCGRGDFGDILRQPALARTLRRLRPSALTSPSLRHVYSIWRTTDGIHKAVCEENWLTPTPRRLAAGGAAEWYEGAIAAEIAAHMAAVGGLITAADLAAYKPRWLAPPRASPSLTFHLH
jgi:gamma-glutamyltranspeptidase